MNALPSSIEAALLEADFSGTEIIILKRLMEEDAMTLRQLALKTGKSTGVLDQAMKKLLKKGIVNKETINDNPKYVLQSLQSISRWMERDMEEKQDMLMRRHKNFETFIATLSVDKERPEMEHFEGEEGMKKAHIKLMEYGEEMLVYMPMIHKEEEDPLRDFRVQLFRERRHRGIFQRVIAHDSPLGRRFQTRDMFEYRKTILVPEPAVPITFEQIIVGDMYACFDHDAKKAVFIRFPHLAQSERSFFEALWQSPHREITIHEVETRQIQPEQTTTAAFKTRLFSSFREFILSRKSIAALAVIAVLSGALTYGLYEYTQALTLQRMKDQVRAVAATAASQFNPEDLAQLQTEADWQKPEWAKVVGQLRDIRVNNPDLLFTYIFRKSQTSPSGVEFVADSHSLNPYANTDSDPLNDVDSNQNGIIEPEGQDKLSPPSDPYPIVPREARDALGSVSPSTNDNFYEDSWGKVITGYAPIRNSNEEIVAVLAVDMEANKLNEFSGRVFQPLIFFVLLFIVFIAIRITAMNRSLVQEFIKTVTLRNWLSGLGLLILLIIGLIYAYQRYHFLRTVEETGRRMQAVAVTSALEFRAEDLNQIHWAKDMKTDAYQRVFKKLNEIRTRNPEVQYAFILRPLNLEQKIWEFVADADANHFLPPSSDMNVDNELSEADENPTPGTAYYSYSGKFNELGLQDSFFEIDSEADQWGRFLAANSPIYDEQGRPVAVLGFSIELSKVQARFGDGIGWFFTAEELVGSVRVFAYFFVLFFVLLLVRFITLRRSKKEADEVRTISRKGMLLLFGIGIVLIAGYYVLYAYMLHEAKRELGERLQAIATTKAMELSSADIGQVHLPEDMQNDAYQRLFRTLNDLRSAHSEITYAYIMRPTMQPDVLEFVVDADANYFTPRFSDQNSDNLISGADENTPPGTRYDAKSYQLGSIGLVKPQYELITDQWGTTLTASAPIRDGSGNVVAILGLDSDFIRLQHEIRRAFLMPSFSLEEALGSIRVLVLFGVIFVALAMIGFAYTDVKFTQELASHLLRRKTMTLLGLIAVVLIGLIWGFHVVSQHSAKREAGERLKSIAATAAPEFDPADIEQIHWARDMKTDAYQRLFTKLNDVRNRNPEILFAYIFRPTSNPEIVQFVADADTNHVLPFHVRDFNQDGEFSNSDTSAPPGAHYDFQGDAAISDGFLRPSFGGVYTDQWGTYITACAPILNKGQVIAVFCVDMDVSNLDRFGF